MALASTVVCLWLGGCTSSTVVGSSVMDARAEVTDHPKTSYPAVEDVPPGPDKPALTADEQSKLKKELIATRERQAKLKAKEDAERADPVKP